ncbi:S8 family serine peptidase [Melittangium boletus]|uniref:Subtilisin J n=1 Tax=Melittangium boletus DSM 14713 TaxID=1294270 RepID=A0A250I7M4_9BACT|nr:S8 family serine peptidase [Melittangium boletus]ATB27869.1 Subtilisin J [Melittangium boletus DSM 14713]
MRVWAILGLAVLAACSNTDSGISGQSHGGCVDVKEDAVAGHLRTKVQDDRQPVIVRYRKGVRSATAVKNLGAPVTAQYTLIPAVAARLTPQEIARLAVSPEVERIEPDLEVRALGMPMTAGSVEEYTDTLRIVQAPRVWDTNEDGVLDRDAPVGSGIRVCVIDSGIDPRHPELRIPYAAGRDFVDNDDDPSDESQGVWGLGHGTHVAGIIAAQLSSGGATWEGMSRGGIMGVAPGVELLIARVLNVEERASVSGVLSALEWCQRQKAHIATLSLGASLDMGRTARDTFQAARDSGMLIVAASGNDSDSLQVAPLSYPAAYPSVLAVGAVDSRGEVAPFSNGGETLSLVAPGVDILSSISVGGNTVSQLDAGVLSYNSRSLFFAPAGDYTGTLIDCGQGNSLECQGGTCEGFVAYVRLEQGSDVSRIARNVMSQGARAIIFGTSDSETQAWQLSLEGPHQTWVPALSVGRESRAAVLQHLGKPIHVNLRGVDYARFMGTSMAAPHVTGVAALLWSARPSLTASEVRELMERTALDLGERGPDTRYGHGLVRARAALDALEGLAPLP